jgi:protein-tyrosine phosphatase
LTGRFGKRAEVISHQLVKNNWVQFVASDAHSIAGRPPCLRQAYELLKNLFGQTTADLLCICNPRAAFMGEPLPPQPDPIGIVDEPKHG